MRVYWDSTALLNAPAAQSVLARLSEGQHKGPPLDLPGCDSLCE
jgi:hypothetical protein